MAYFKFSLYWLLSVNIDNQKTISMFDLMYLMLSSLIERQMSFFQLYQLWSNRAETTYFHYCFLKDFLVCFSKKDIVNHPFFLFEVFNLKEKDPNFQFWCPEDTWALLSPGIKTLKLNLSNSIKEVKMLFFATWFPTAEADWWQWRFDKIWTLCIVIIINTNPPFQGLVVHFNTNKLFFV